MLTRWKTQRQTSAQSYKTARNKKQHEMIMILETEIPRFIRMTMPTFFLLPEIERSLYQHLRSDQVSLNYPRLPLTKEMRKAISFYAKELSVFVTYLEQKGFQMKDNETLFAHVFLNTVEICNFQEMHKRYGQITEDARTVAAVFDEYLYRVDRENYYNIGHLEFLRQHLVSQKLVPVTLRLQKLKKQLRQYEEGGRMFKERNSPGRRKVVE